MLRSQKIAAFSLSLALALSPVAAWADPTPQEKETARNLMDEGDKLAAKKEWKAALQAYQAAHDIMKVPTTGLEVGRAQAALGLLVEARDTWLAVGRSEKKPGEGAAFGAARAEAEKLAAQVASRIPSVRIARIEGPSDGRAEVTVDGVPVAAAALALPIKVNPGTHVLAARRAGFEDAKATVTLAEGEAKDVPLALRPAAGVPAAPSSSAPKPPPAPSTTSAPPAVTEPSDAKRHPLVVPGFAIAGAGAVLGTVFGALSLSKASSVRDQCREDKTCPPSAQGDIDATKRWATLSNVGFGLAIVGAGLGVTGLVLGGKRSETALVVEPRGLAVRRTF